MSELTPKQVKVDNWGIYFLQRLKHFFNRTDYCDLTLQFQDNAQLKVHRLVLSACTEYFELLERTCEMYEDCLVMPDDLQADVVVPIINFMYTGQLEFKQDLLEKLYQTSLIMNMPVLTKLLDSHRVHVRQSPAKPAFQNSSNYYGKRYLKSTRPIPFPGNSSSSKRSFTSAFLDTVDPTKMKKQSISETMTKADCIVKNGKTPSYQFPVFSEKNKRLLKDPRPTRYELPEELDEDNIFDNSFTNISYTSKPLMVHPETTKQYSSKRSINLFEESTSSNHFIRTNSANDIVECRKISINDNIFVDDLSDNMQDECNFQQSPPMKDDNKDTSQLFDQILDNNTSKITIEAKNNPQGSNMDHAKIISEVLKKYPQLVKSNKNIKLKILNTSKTKKPQASTSSNEEKVKSKCTVPDFTYESDVINSKEAARLIALGAENVAGPWICLICGTPGKALHFTSYFNFRKHLVEVHNEKPVPTICEYCGVKSQKRNYLVYHKLTKHGVPAPTHYNFPKCNYCSYIALNEALMVKHKVSHSDKYKFPLSTIPPSGHVASAPKGSQKYLSTTISDKQKSQCTYCMRVFLRERNLYAHLKTNHKEAAKADGLIDDSEEEQEEEEKYASKLKSNNDDNSNFIKVEVPGNFDSPFEDGNDQYQIEQKPDGSIYVVSKKPRVMLPSNKHKILNLGFDSPNPNTTSLTQSQKPDNSQNASLKKSEFSQNAYVSSAKHIANEDIVIIDNNEYILRDNQLIPRKEKLAGQYIPISNASCNTEVTIQTMMPTTSMEYHNILNTNPEHKVLVKKSTRVNHQPLQIVVSNEEEYKALINANQSVIYDERETNKAIASLTGENQSLETATIDLDNNQSNDMMIIQDDFPMNVTETVSTDNSNIVVVYSHPLEDQSKQYSLITTQGIEGEFIQSSTILTQNYETVTTGTPVMSAHTTIDNSWQNNIHTNINKLTIAPSSELQAMTVGESITIAPIETDTLNELPEVSLTTTETVPAQLAHSDTSGKSFSQSNVIAEMHQQSGDVCSQRNTIMTVTNSGQQSAIITVTESSVLNNVNQQITHMPALSVPNLDQADAISSFTQTTTVNDNVEQIVTPTSSSQDINPNILSTSQVQEILHRENPNISDTVTAQGDIVESNTCVVPSKEITNIQPTEPHRLRDINSPHHLPDNNFIRKPVEQATTVEEDIKKQEPVKEIIVEQGIDNITEDKGDNEINTSNNEPSLMNESDIGIPIVAKEQLENLSSEWSEEESDKPIQEKTSKDKRNKSQESTHFDDHQKEVEQQVSSELDHDTEDSIASSQDDNISNRKSQSNSNVDKSIDAESQEKITSLLNDWDDNDSQEDETSVITEEEANDQTGNSSVPVEEVVIISKNESDNNSEINENDKIKSLVSDWDEEEDENKG